MVSPRAGQARPDWARHDRGGGEGKMRALGWVEVLWRDGQIWWGVMPRDRRQA